jgi:hypothetical protein
MKLTKRKAFKFFRSYYDVYNELESDKDKLAFIEALLDKQFLGKEPNLKGMAKFAYISQINSIDSQVSGYEAKTGAKLGGTLGGTLGACLQEEEKEKEQDVKKIPAYSDFKEYAYSKKKNLDPEALKLKYDSWVDNGWKNGNDKPIKNWKTTLLNTIPYIKTINNHNNIQPQHNLKDLYE